MQQYILNRQTLVVLLFITAGSSCKKFVEVGSPETSISSTNAFAEDQTAIATVTSMYYNKMENGVFAGPTGINSFSIICGLSADEFDLLPSSEATPNYYYQNSLMANTIGFWGQLYSPAGVSGCNTAIEALIKSTTLTPFVKRQLLAEAKFMRAFNYFYLVNLFGDVPLILTTDYKVSRVMPRTAVGTVYQQIIGDLKDAQADLSENFLNGSLQTYVGTPERIRPTKWAATALLARVYLFISDWVSAEIESSKLIDNSLFSLSSLNSAFLKASLGNKEAIWQLQPIQIGFNTQDARCLIIPGTGLTPDQRVKLSSDLLNEFESGDQRSIPGNWLDSVNLGIATYYYPFKYKINTSPAVTKTSGAAAMSEFLNVFRLAEQYLIRAEARAEQNDIAGAKADLNMVRTRAGLSNSADSDQETLRAAILHERRVELFSEWGHRWFDLKRTANVNTVMVPISTAKGGSWEETDQFYPIPATEIQLNPNLSQNDGY